MQPPGRSVLLFCFPTVISSTPAPPCEMGAPFSCHTFSGASKSVFYVKRSFVESVTRVPCLGMAARCLFVDDTRRRNSRRQCSAVLYCTVLLHCTVPATTPWFVYLCCRVPASGALEKICTVVGRLFGVRCLFVCSFPAFPVTVALRSVSTPFPRASSKLRRTKLLEVNLSPRSTRSSSVTGLGGSSGHGVILPVPASSARSARVLLSRYGRVALPAAVALELSLLLLVVRALCHRSVSLQRKKMLGD